jgi:EpsI family protein
LKQWISEIVVELLYHVGYPISRTGVVLSIGQYQLQVADACSGLHSMYSLSALGTLFMYIMARPSRLHNAIMLVSILPIAFAANIVRVIALVLITYHMGDKAGHFVHDGAGIVLMLVALVLFFALDALLARARIGGQPSTRDGSHHVYSPASGANMRLTSVAWVMGALMWGAAVVAVAGKPSTALPPINLQKVVPDKFGVWSEVKEAGLVVNPQVPALIEKIYDEVLTRTYVNRDGDRIMLSMAWGNDQRDERQAHRPEICYPAQGFDVEKLSDGTLATSFGDIRVRRFNTSGTRHEPVTYWLTMAGSVVTNDFDKRMVQLDLVRTGQIPDGLLFRVSSIDRDTTHAFAIQQHFVGDMMASVSQEARQRLSGLRSPIRVSGAE